MTPEQWKLFLKQTKQDAGCLVWTGPGFGDEGYGLSKEHKKLAHRVAHEHYTGHKIPVGFVVAQSCGNHRCVEEGHLVEEYVGRV